MQIIYLLLFVIALLAIITALKLPKNFNENENKRKVFRKKKRNEEKDSIFKT